MSVRKCVMKDHRKVKDTKGVIRSVNRRTDNEMAKRKSTKGQTMTVQQKAKY